jgi:hypothetical protein
MRTIKSFFARAVIKLCNRIIDYACEVEWANANYIEFMFTPGGTDDE